MVIKKLQFLIFLLSATDVLGYYPAIDQSVVENALDTELCDQQLQEIVTNPQLLLTFLDSGIRFPRGILKGNLVDYGNYHQCLEINQQLTNSMSTVEGKYCSISIVPSLEIVDSVQNNTDLRLAVDLVGFETIRNAEINEQISQYVMQYERMKREIDIFTGHIFRTADGLETVSQLSLTVAMCLPKVCSTTQVFNYLLNSTFSNVTELITENYCRLPNDKPWVPVDYVTVSLFSFIGLLTIISTSYDLYQTFGTDHDEKSVNKLFTSFSIYTNTRRLVTYNSSPKTIECMDGIRVIATAWVMLGHRYYSVLDRPVVNLIDSLEWALSLESIWVSAGPITVDTFFFMSGLLIVYTTAGKLTNMKLLKNIHVFYLNRLLRMFPMLAVAILIHASIINKVVDGPNWTNLSSVIESCRANWWATLLYVQNYVTLSEGTAICIGQSWYLAVDMQLHLLSPIVLFWVLSNRKAAWISLIGVTLVSMVATSTYVFLNNFQAGLLNTNSNIVDYFYNYYINTLTRATPFLVGMIYGYILHEMNGRKISNQSLGIFLWAVATAVSAFVIYSHYPLNKADWDNDLLNNLANTFIRPVWAVAIGWMILACHSGFGGPINWFLSLRLWKIPARLSYAMYLFHYVFINAINATDTGLIYFTPGGIFFYYLGDIMLTVVVAFLATVIIDAPCSTLIKMAMGGGIKKPVHNHNENTKHPDIAKTMS